MTLKEKLQAALENPFTVDRYWQYDPDDEYNVDIILKVVAEHLAGVQLGLFE